MNTAFDERQPALTPDERYLAFVRDGRGNHASLFMWDSQTQTLLNPVGVDLGANADTNRDVGSVSLFFHPLIKGRPSSAPAACSTSTSPGRRASGSSSSASSARTACWAGRATSSVRPSASRSARSRRAATASAGI